MKTKFIICCLILIASWDAYSSRLGISKGLREDAIRKERILERERERASRVDPDDGVFGFIATADPQFDNGDTSRNAISQRTMLAIKNTLESNKRFYKGVVIAGDLTQNTRKDEFDLYKESISEIKEYVYEGQGNHDDTDAEWFQRAACPSLNHCVSQSDIISYIRGRTREKKIHLNSEGGVYSWDWENVHFIQLGSFAANEKNTGGHFPDVDPYNALSFLQEDLRERVGQSGRPVILIMHYQLYSEIGSGERDAWTEQQVADMWESLEGYNVKAVFSGHVHLEKNSTNWVTNVSRPAKATSGPSHLMNIISGATLNGIFIEASVNNHKMTLQRYHVNANGAAEAINQPVILDVSPDTSGDDPIDLSNMQADNTYNLIVRSHHNRCNLQYQGGGVNGNDELNAKFDCSSNGDVMRFHATANPVLNADGTHSIDGNLSTSPGADQTCALEWDSVINRGVRNAKFDCSSVGDPITITTVKDHPEQVTIKSLDCGLVWGEKVSVERNAEYDCTPSYRTFILDSVN